MTVVRTSVAAAAPLLQMAVGRVLTRLGLIVGAQLLAALATAVVTFGLAIELFEASGSGAAYGMVMGLAMLPQTLGLPLGGVVSDRRGRVYAMVLGHGVTGGFVAMLGLVSWNGAASHAMLVLLASGMLLLRGLCFSSVIALMPELLPRARLARANAVFAVGMWGPALLGPVIAGFAVGRVGFAGLCLIVTPAFLVAIGSLALASGTGGLIRPIPPPETGRSGGSAGSDVVMAVRYLFASRHLVHLLLLGVGLQYAVRTVEVTVPVLALRHFSVPAAGMVVGAGGAAMVLVGVGFAIARRPPRDPVLGALRSVMLACAGLAVVGLAQSLWLMALGMMLFCGGAAAYLVLALTLWQAHVPAELRGRVFVLRYLLEGAAAPVALILGGRIPIWLDAAWPVAATGVPGGRLLLFALAGILGSVALVLKRRRVA